MKQHKKPCNECPFRRAAPAGYLGSNEARNFVVLSNHDVTLPCHKQMHQPEPAQCAGRAIMWRNQGKLSRTGIVPQLEPDQKNVFSHVREFADHHKIVVTPMQLMGVEPLEDER